MKKSIVFYIDRSWEEWNKNSVRSKGSGGSETAVVELADIFAKNGYDVTVYNEPGKEGDYDGVRYLHYSKFIGSKGDILIASRTPWAVEDRYNTQYTKKYLWLHDAHLANTFQESHMYKFDRIIPLTEWHRNYLLDYYNFLLPIKMKIIPNGFDDVELYKNHLITRNPHKAIYSSSPSRGLDLLCGMWKDIRDVIPGAELHVFYGFDVWELAAKQNTADLPKIQKVKQIAENTPGVILRGRVSRETLINEQLSSGVWTYPTNWYETSCVAAMEAKAAGLYTVTTALAALPETVGTHGYLINKNPNSEEYKKEFINKTIEYMKYPDNGYRKSIQEYAYNNLTRESVSKIWLEMFERDLGGGNTVDKKFFSITEEDKKHYPISKFLSEIRTRNNIPNFLTKINAERTCEIGVRDGGNFKNILTPFVNLAVGIDVWKNTGVISQNDDFSSQENLDNRYLNFVNYYKNDSRVKVIRDFSINASFQFENNFFDFVYIDADHTYEASYMDICAWYPKVKPGGILAGHDYNHQDLSCLSRGLIFGVTKAVNKFVKENNLFLYTDLDDPINWYIVKENI